VLRNHLIMTKLESRDSRQSVGRDVLSGYPGQPGITAMRKALKELAEITRSMKVLGCYQRKRGAGRSGLTFDKRQFLHPCHVPAG
jgi:prephenate dehydratase